MPRLVRLPVRRTSTGVVVKIYTNDEGRHLSVGDVVRWAEALGLQPADVAIPVELRITSARWADPDRVVVDRDTEDAHPVIAEVKVIDRSTSPTGQVLYDGYHETALFRWQQIPLTALPLPDGDSLPASGTQRRLRDLADKAAS